MHGNPPVHSGDCFSPAFGYNTPGFHQGAREQAWQLSTAGLHVHPPGQELSGTIPGTIQDCMHAAPGFEKHAPPYAQIIRIQ